MKLKMIAVAALAALIALPCNAADEAKKKKKGKRGEQNAATQLIKQLEAVGLTDEQVEKIKEMGKTAAAAMKSIRDDAGITAELTKKRTEIQKAMRDSGKKGKELVAAINKEAGFTEAQAAALLKLNQARQKFQRDVVGMLSDEQKEKLPERLQKIAKPKGKGKKKKDAA